MFTVIFNLSLSQCIIPTCFNKSVFIPVPKKAQSTSLNDYRPAALTSVVMKCSPPPLDPLQFAYRPNGSTDVTIPSLVHAALNHLDSGRGNDVRMLFVDYSSAFDAIVPSRLYQQAE